MPVHPTATHPPASRLAGALLLAVSTLWCIYWFLHARGYWEDDAYIHLEFARSVASGRGFAFNGHVVAGDTAPLWVVLLAAVHTIVPDWMTAGKTLTICGAFFGLTGIYAFARKMAAQLVPNENLFPAAMVLLTVANPYSCYWLFSGMEPIAAAGLACFAVLAATSDQPSTKSFLTACLLAGIAPLLRPEMIFLTALLALPLFAQLRRLRASPISFAGVILLAAPLLIWSIYSLHAFGHILPNTNAAKRSSPGDSVVLRLLSIYSIGFPVILCGFLAGIACLMLRPSKVPQSIRHAISSTLARIPRPSSGLPFAGWIFILWPSIAAIFYIADHTYVQTRYILVAAPGLTIVIVLLALRASQLAGRALYMLALVSALTVSLVTVRPFLHNKALNCQAIRELAVYIRDHIPPNSPVADYAIGEIAFVSQHPIIDTGGITHPDAIQYASEPADMTRWAKSEGAQYSIASYPPEPGAIAVYTARLPFVGWTFHTALYATSRQATLWKLTPSSDPQPSPQGAVVVHP